MKNPSSPGSVGRAWKIALSGGAVIALAAVLEFAPPSTIVSQLRVVMTFAGALAVGIAIYLNPVHVGLLTFATAAAVLARFGFPVEWDSGRVLSGMGAIAAGIGAVLVALPVNYRKVAASVLMLIHFGGILTAVTSPLSPPWLTMTVGLLFYRPYLQSTYLTNAYHFYSPEPGPASQAWFCIRYKPDANGVVAVRWVKFPRRPDDMHDPLALSYYRRLSLTMRMEDKGAGIVTDEMKRARLAMAQGKNGIPIHPEYIPLETQYHLPADAVRDFVLPSYVRHVANHPANQHDDGVTPIDTIKVYLVQHEILTPHKMQMGLKPYDPITYKPFYFGEFEPDGDLANPNDPLLYWLVPIIAIPKGDVLPGHTYGSHPEEFEIVDGVKIHTGGSDHNVR